MDAGGEGPTTLERVIGMVFYGALGVWLVSGIAVDLDPPFLDGIEAANLIARRLGVAAFATAAFQLVGLGLRRLRRPRG